MSALHWEARRKQSVVDRREKKTEEENQKYDSDNEDPYNSKRIQNVAEDMCRDPATPVPSLLNRSHARLVKKQKSQSREPEIDEYKKCGKILGKDGYDAKISNRYSSIDYIQQY